MTDTKTTTGSQIFFANLRERECVELRVLGMPTGYGAVTASGYFDNAADLDRQAAHATATGGNAYCTINPCPLDLSARSGLNKIGTKKGLATTADKDIKRRALLLFDLDHCRPSGIAATKREMQRAQILAHTMADELTEEGWPAPLIAYSGNGCHLYYKIDLPNDANSLGLIKAVLKAAQDRWGSVDRVKIDQTVANAARISRLPGTVNRKGAGDDDRPHRMSEVASLPEYWGSLDPSLVSVEQLGKLAGRMGATPTHPQRKTTAQAARQRFDLELFLANNLPDAIGPEPYSGGGDKWILPFCPWNPAHDNRSAWVIRLAGGGLSAGCHHDGCTGKKWEDLRRLFEPDYDQRQWPQAEWEDDATAPAPTEPATAEPVDHTEALNGEAWTDLGNARSMILLYGHRFRWCAKSGKWMIWSGKHWHEDSHNKALAWANKTILARAAAAEKLDEDEQKKALKYFKGCEATAKRNSLLEQVKAWAPAVVTIEELDRDHWLLNVQNGTLNLRTGKLSPHRQADYITRILDAEYDPAAPCPLWDAYLDRSMDGDREMVSFLRRAVGYSLTGSTREHAIFVLFGNGGTGKSVFMSVLGKLLAGYACAAQASTFGESKNENIRNDVARLKGARLVHCSETKDGFRFDEGLLKQMTGQDKLSARFLHCEHFEFYPCFKIWIATNYAPQIRGTDDGIWRRIRLIPWPVKVPPEEIDKDLVDKLATELPGILAWAVRGCEEWIALGGLREPAKIEQSTQEYRSEMDLFGSFLESCCVFGQYETGSTEFYTRYRQWLATQGEYEITQTKMGLILKSRGFEAKRTLSGRVWLGIGIK